MKIFVLIVTTIAFAVMSGIVSYAAPPTQRTPYQELADCTTAARDSYNKDTAEEARKLHEAVLKEPTKGAEYTASYTEWLKERWNRYVNEETRQCNEDYAAALGNSGQKTQKTKGYQPGKSEKGNQPWR